MFRNNASSAFSRQWCILLAVALLAPAGVVQAYEDPSQVQFGVFAADGALETQPLSEFEGKIVALYYFSPW